MGRGTWPRNLSRLAAHHTIHLTGCHFVLGSRSSTTGWTWNTKNGRLQTLYMGSGFGFTGALNASTSTFSECFKKSTTLYNAAGEWSPVVVEPSIVFFKLHGMWHLSWVGITCVVVHVHHTMYLVVMHATTRRSSRPFRDDH